MCIYLYVSEMFFYWNFLKPVPFLGQLCFQNFEAADLFQTNVHCLDLILQIFSTDTSYLVLKDTSRIPFTFQQTSGCFCFIRRPLAFSNSSNKHDLFRLAPKQTRRPVKTPGEKMWWKKKRILPDCKLYNMSAAETIETHAKALTDTQCSFPVRRYQQPQHEGLSQTRVCIIYN